MAYTQKVNLPLHAAADTIYDAIVNGSITGEMIDKYVLAAPSGAQCIVMVFEKHFYRAGNRLTLTVTLDDFEGVARVHAIGGGGGEGLFRFDWGASESFAEAVECAMRPYTI